MDAIREMNILSISIMVGGCMGALFAPPDFAGSLSIYLVVMGSISGSLIGGGLCLFIEDQGPSRLRPDQDPHMPRQSDGVVR